MNTLEIDYLLRNNKHTRTFFDKVYAADMIPRYIDPHKTTMFVANTSNSSSPGTHWVAVYINRNCLEFFDSGNVALKINKYFRDFIRRNPRQIIRHNTRQIQSNYSNICGQYSILFLLHKSQGKSFNSFINIFKNKNKLINDLVAIKLFNKYMKK